MDPSYLHGVWKDVKGNFIYILHYEDDDFRIEFNRDQVFLGGPNRDRYNPLNFIFQSDEYTRVEIKVIAVNPLTIQILGAYFLNPEIFIAVG